MERVAQCMRFIQDALVTATDSLLFLALAVWLMAHFVLGCGRHGNHLSFRFWL